MKLTFESAEALEWANPEHTTVNMMVKFTEFTDSLPFSASTNDTELHSKFIFEQAISGNLGIILPYVTSPKTTDQIISEFTLAIQQRLDNFARTRNYDNILSACTYATSTVPKFAVEGQYCVDARDATWSTCYSILSDVQSGSRTMPTLDQIMNELPALEWPQ